MSPSSDMLNPNTIHFNKVENFTLGFKELLFLSFTLFIGFYGFSICVEKIYATDTHTIESITVHTKMISENSSSVTRNLTLVSN